MNGNPKRVRPRTRLLLAAAAVVAGGATAATSYGAAAKPKDVKAKIHLGVLTVTGTKQDDTIALRLRAGDPSVLELVVDGEATDDFKQSQIDRIVVDGAAGDDDIAIDESGGPFTNTEPTTLNGDDGNDTLQGGS